MNYENWTSRQLKERIEFFKKRLRNQFEEEDFRALITLEHLFETRLAGPLASYARNTRPCHREVLTRLRTIYYNDTSDNLIKQAYVIAYFGTCMSSVLYIAEFSDLKPFFPTMKLPLIISESDLITYVHEAYRNVSLSESIRNFIVDYRQFSRGKPEEFLKKLWQPVILTMFNSAKLKYNIQDLELIPEFDARNIKTIRDMRYFDYVIADGHEGLPILIVEIAARPVRSGSIHKDTRKIALSMSHILMQLVQRSSNHCPEYDFTKFRVFGLLIGGSEFEFCVGSIVKNEAGQINFMFNSDSVKWKFDLLQPWEANNIESHSLCTDDYIQISNFEDDSTHPFGPDSTNLSIDFNLIADVFDEEQSNPDERVPVINRLMESTVKSEVVLWKFISLVTSYYSELDPCLRECIQKVHEGDLESNQVYDFPPEEARPSIAPSSSYLSGRSLQVSPQSYNVSVIAQTEDQQFILSHLFKYKFQTLPDILMYNTNTKNAIVRYQDYHLDTFSNMIKTIIEANEEMVFSNAQLALIDAKFMLDMLLAAYKLHSMGYVCGCFEPSNITFDGFFFHVDYLSHVIREDKCDGYVLTGKRASDLAYHTEMNPLKLSKRDDLFSIFKCTFFGLRSYLNPILCQCEDIPLFRKFLDLSLVPMGRLQMYPELDVGLILKDVIPIYDQMIQEFANTDMDYIFSTQTLANHVLEDILTSTHRGGLNTLVESVSRAEIEVSSASELK